MKNKSETRSLLDSFVNYVKTQFNKCVKIMRTDNGAEFDYKNLYNSFGILHQTSCVETPEQNSIVERKHQHILNVVRSIMFHYNLPKQFWCYAVCHAIYIINRLPSTAIHFKVPYELLYGQKPDMSMLRVFGCLCFASTIARNRDKLHFRSRKCIFLGFKTGVKGYVVLDIKIREVLISRDVVFHEEICIEPEDNDERLDDILEQDFFYLPYESTYDYAKENMQPEENEHENNDLTRYMRSRKAPEYLKDYHHGISNITKTKLEKPKVKYPISSVLSYDTMNQKQLHLVYSISSHDEPSSYEEAGKIAQWRDVMEAETEALKANNTWFIIELPSGKTLIGCKWIFKLKFNANGVIERHKARLVAKG